LDGFDGITSKLLTIRLYDMTNLTKVCDLPPTNEFMMEGCTKIKSIKLPRTKEYDPKSTERNTAFGGVEINSCDSLTSIEFVCSPDKLYIKYCPKPIKFINAPDTFGKLYLWHCNGIKNLKGLPSRLSNLEIGKCGSFSSLKGDVKEISNNLKIIDCPNLTDFKGIPQVEYELFVENCPITDWKVERKGRWFNAAYKYLPKGTKKPQWGVDGYWDERREWPY
jgi:hypothetical protein